MSFHRRVHTVKVKIYTIVRSYCEVDVCMYVCMYSIPERSSSSALDHSLVNLIA